MQKDEIWELKPEGAQDSEGPPKEAAAGDKPAGGKKKEPDRVDMDEILELKPDEEAPGTPSSDKKQEMELVDIEDKKDDESVVIPSRKEEKVISMDKPQVLDPGESKPSNGKAPEFAVGNVKKFERAAPVVRESVAAGDHSKLLTAGLAVALIFLAGTAALLSLPFFGIETIPDEMPVVGQILEFYRTLPLLPE